jgi:hypothetical protein
MKFFSTFLAVMLFAVIGAAQDSTLDLSQPKDFDCTDKRITENKRAKDENDVIKFSKVGTSLFWEYANGEKKQSEIVLTSIVPPVMYERWEKTYIGFMSHNRLVAASLFLNIKTGNVFRATLNWAAPWSQSNPTLSSSLRQTFVCNEH